MSWSQYPLDETLERAYCSEYFGEVSASSLHIYKEPFGNSAGCFGNNSAAGSTRVATVSAAMALGAGRAAGIIPQFSAAQAFNRVKTSILPTPTGSASLDFSFSKHSEAQPKPCNSPTKLFSQCVTDLGIPTTMVLEPEQFSTAFSFHGLAPSLPSSQVENPSIIPVIGACGVTVKSISSKYSKHLELQVSDENIGRDGLTGPSKLNALTTARSDEDEPQTVGMSYINSRTASNMISRNISSLKNKSESTVSAADEHYLEPNYSYTSGSRASGTAERVQASDPRERPVQHDVRIYNTPDLTETSSGRAEDADFRGARMQRSTTPLYRRDVSELENQSTDCQFNENQNAFIEQNKLESKRIRSKPSKRRRTAEVHNLSERVRSTPSA